MSKKWRIVAIAVAGLALVAAVLAYREFYLVRPEGEGPAGPAVDAAPFGQVWSQRKVLLLGVGDSVTAGFGVPAPLGYVARLADNPPEEFDDMRGLCLRAVLPNLTVENLAVSGTTSIEHERILQERLTPRDAQTMGIVVVTTGGNDLIHNCGRTPAREGAMYGATLDEARPWIDAFEQRLDRIIDLLESRLPGGCHVFVGDIYDPTDGVGDATGAGLPDWPDGLAICRAYNEALHRWAARRGNVHLVPMREAFLGHGIHCRQPWREHYRPEDPHYWYGVNLEDPNQRGYDAIRRVFLIEMAKVLPEALKGSSGGTTKAPEHEGGAGRSGTWRASLFSHPHRALASDPSPRGRGETRG